MVLRKNAYQRQAGVAASNACDLLKLLQGEKRIVRVEHDLRFEPMLEGIEHAEDAVRGLDDEGVLASAAKDTSSWTLVDVLLDFVVQTVVVRIKADAGHFIRNGLGVELMQIRQANHFLSAVNCDGPHQTRVKRVHFLRACLFEDFLGVLVVSNKTKIIIVL